ncbi:MAG: hypothetical protein K1X75_09590 [Leptospirales bacterium]|nr:hypothetical protein [Leptospirales bacterium]
MSANHQNSVEEALARLESDTQFPRAMARRVAVAAARRRQTRVPAWMLSAAAAIVALLLGFVVTRWIQNASGEMALSDAEIVRYESELLEARSVPDHNEMWSETDQIIDGALAAR